MKCTRFWILKKDIPSTGIVDLVDMWLSVLGCCLIEYDKSIKTECTLTLKCQFGILGHLPHLGHSFNKIRCSLLMQGGEMFMIECSCMFQYRCNLDDERCSPVLTSAEHYLSFTDSNFVTEVPYLEPVTFASN